MDGVYRLSGSFAITEPPVSPELARMLSKADELSGTLNYRLTEPRHFLLALYEHRVSDVSQILQKSLTTDDMRLARVPSPVEWQRRGGQNFLAASSSRVLEKAAEMARTALVEGVNDERLPSLVHLALALLADEETVRLLLRAGVNSLQISALQHELTLLMDRPPQTYDADNVVVFPR
jgi:ATP-dependent Clp protease ATP-binding subunit ClpA